MKRFIDAMMFTAFGLPILISVSGFAVLAAAYLCMAGYLYLVDWLRLLLMWIG